MKTLSRSLPLVVCAVLLGCTDNGPGEGVGAGGTDSAGGLGSGSGGLGAAGIMGGAAVGAGTSGSGGASGGSGGASGGSAGAAPVQGACADLGSLPTARRFSPKRFSEGEDPAADPECTEIINPERGFRSTANLRAASNFTSEREQGRSTVYGAVLLDDYADQELDQQLLTRLGDNFATARDAGIKLLPRFYYQADLSAGSSDAPLARVLAHIEQLAPLLQSNADVIAALHAGFLGAWGEWHGSTTGLHEQEPREQILAALLAGLPASRMLLVRRPSFKALAYPDGPLTEDTAYDEGALARLGHLNDCLLASESDFGTYQEPDEKAYAEADSAFTAVDGETCALNPPRSECAAAKLELSLHHFSTLNIDYHEGVLDSWRSGGCFGEIACRLGYRLVVLGLAAPEVAPAGDVLSVSVSLTNDGYARPFNARPVYLVLDGPERRSFLVDVDPRRFAPGAEIELCLGAALPEDLPPGAYRLGLALPDAAPALATDERYALRLANDVTWQDGVNWLDASVTVTE